MLDRYYEGVVERISPEAPVPIIDIKKTVDILGGAANVMSNAAALGAKVWGLGVVGNDNDGKSTVKLLSQKGINNRYVIKDERRPTTLKCRLMSEHHQMMRYDIESRDEISEEIESKIIEGVDNLIDKISFLAISDYDKGTMTPSLIEKVLKIARTHSVKVVVDPKLRRFHDYQRADYVKLNLHHAEETTGLKYSSIQDIRRMGHKISDLLNCDNVILTMGKDGLSVLSNSGFTHIPALAREVYDVTGAGDVITAVLCVSLATGYDLVTACKLSTIAAAIKVAKVGTYSVSYKELVNSVKLYRNELSA